MSDLSEWQHGDRTGYLYTSGLEIRWMNCVYDQDSYEWVDVGHSNERADEIEGRDAAG